MPHNGRKRGKNNLLVFTRYLFSTKRDGNTMLRFLSLTTALSTALISFLPKVAFGIPPAGNIYDSQSEIAYPSSDSNSVIINSTDRFPTRVGYPVNNQGTVIVNPNNRLPTRVGYPINNYGTVIINQNNVNRTFRQNSCGSAIIGNPIPSPVPVNLYTGRFCQ